MRHKKYLLFLVFEALLLLAASLLLRKSNIETASIMAFPFAWIASALKRLAECSNLGNGVAWALLVAISLIPTLLYVGGKERKKSALECVMLNFTSIVIFGTLFGMINPGFFFKSEMLEFQTVLSAVLGITAWSCIIACIVIRLLCLFKTGAADELRKYLVFGIRAFGALLVGYVFSLPGTDLLERISKSVGAADVLFDVLVFVATVVPCLLNLAVCFAVDDLLGALEREDTENIIMFAEKVVKRCCPALGIMSVLTAVLNVLKIFFAGLLSDVHAYMNIPVTNIFFALLILLVSRLLVENRKLRDDNSLFV